MKTMLSYILILVGILVMATAFAQWTKIDYPDLFPFLPTIFTTGMIDYTLNYLVTAVAGLVGWKIFSYGSSLTSIQQESN